MLEKKTKNSNHHKRHYRLQPSEQVVTALALTSETVNKSTKRITQRRDTNKGIAPDNKQKINFIKIQNKGNKRYLISFVTFVLYFYEMESFNIIKNVSITKKATNNTYKLTRNQNGSTTLGWPAMNLLGEGGARALNRFAVDQATKDTEKRGDAIHLKEK